MVFRALSEPTAKSEGKRTVSRRDIPNSSQSTRLFLVYLWGSHKESHLSKGLSSADRKLSVKVPMASLPPLGDLLPENGPTQRKAGTQQKSFLSILFKFLDLAMPEVPEVLDSKSQ